MRPRLPYALALAATVALGLLSRHAHRAVPKSVGDVLWATAVYLAAALIAPGLRPAAVWSAAFGAGAAVELFKLYDPPYLAAFRRGAAGGLLLGHAFSWGNIACYAAGATLGLAVDAALARRRKRA